MCWRAGAPAEADHSLKDAARVARLVDLVLDDHLPLPLTELVRIYGLRNLVEQSYKQMKDELGWAAFASTPLPAELVAGRIKRRSRD